MSPDYAMLALPDQRRASMAQQDDDLAHVIAVTRKRCKDKGLLEVLLVALKHPDLVRAKQTTSGIMLIGPTGSASAHYTASDHRYLKNFTSVLRKAGLYPAKGSKR